METSDNIGNSSTIAEVKQGGQAAPVGTTKMLKHKNLLNNYAQVLIDLQF